jgi:hypothetical protein
MLTMFWIERQVDWLLFQLDPIWAAIAERWTMEAVGVVDVLGSGPLPRVARRARHDMADVYARRAERRLRPQL